MDMYKITNKATTYIAVENVNLAPGQSTNASLITEALHYLASKGAIKIELIKQEAPKSAPVAFIPKPTVKFKKENR
jgi:hypothetical protein